MNQQLAVRNGKHLAFPGEQENPLDNLPRWLTYLVGAYPGSKLSEETFMVMEDAFVDFDPAVLFESARQFTRTDARDYKDTPGGFPTVREFRPIVERVKAREDEARAERAAIWFDRCQVLRARRLEILEGWYEGAVTDYQLSQFADEMHAAGMEHAAANLRGKLQ